MKRAIKPPIWPIYQMTETELYTGLEIKVKTMHAGLLVESRQVLSQSTLGLRSQQLDSVIEYTRASVLRQVHRHIETPA